MRIRMLCRYSVIQCIFTNQDHNNNKRDTGSLLQTFWDKINFQAYCACYKLTKCQTQTHDNIFPQEKHMLTPTQFMWRQWCLCHSVCGHSCLNMCESFLSALYITKLHIQNVQPFKYRQFCNKLVVPLYWF